MKFGSEKWGPSHGPGPRPSSASPSPWPLRATTPCAARRPAQAAPSQGEHGPWMENVGWFTNENGWVSIATIVKVLARFFFLTWRCSGSEGNEEPRKWIVHSVGWVERIFLKNWRWTFQKLIVDLIAWPETLKKNVIIMSQAIPKLRLPHFCFQMVVIS